MLRADVTERPVGEPDYPPFEQASSRFERFLTENECPAYIVWVGSEDVVRMAERVYMHSKVNEMELAERARTEYALACERRRGVLLQLIAISQSVSYCGIWSPQSDIDAEYALMPDGLKLQIPTSIPQACLVNSNLMWTFLSWRSRRLWRPE